MTESVKDSDIAEQTGDLSVPKPGPVGGIGGVVLIPIVVVLLVGVFFFLPLSSTISGSLTIATTTIGLQNQVKLELSSVSYSRDTIFRSISVGAGRIELPVRPSVAGTYTMTIQVGYGTASPLVQTFDQIGDGTYGFKIRYIFLHSIKVPTTDIPSAKLPTM